MKNTKALFLVLLLAVLLCAACGQTNQPATSDPAANEGLTVTDMTGHQVTLSGPAQQVVALTAADCEILYALGAGDTLVGRGQYCDYPEEALSVPEVQSGSETNIEEIIALSPQVVLMSTMDQSEDQITALKQAGIQVVESDVYEAEGIAAVYQSIRLIGAVVGKDAEAEALVASMEDCFTQLADKASGDGTQTVYFEVSPLEYGLWTAGSGTFMDELATLLGMSNAFADMDAWAEVSEEQVIARDPDFIVTITMSFGDDSSPVDEILSRPGWQEMSAVKNGRVFCAGSDAITRPGPRLAEGAQMLYDFFYGEAE